MLQNKRYFFTLVPSQYIGLNSYNIYQWRCLFYCLWIMETDSKYWRVPGREWLKRKKQEKDTYTIKEFPERIKKRKKNQLQHMNNSGPQLPGLYKMQSQ